MTNDVHSRIARARELDAKAGAIERLWPHMTGAEDFDGQREALREMDTITPGLADLALALADDAEKMLGLLMTVAQNARMVRAVAESYAELDPKWAKSTLDYFHGVVTEPLERAYAELSAKEVTP